VWLFAIHVAAMSALAFLLSWTAMGHEEAIITAEAAAVFLQAAGQDVTIDGAKLGLGGAQALLEVEGRCTIVPYAVLLIAAILAFPGSLAAKVAGIAGALAALWIANILRVATLFLVGAYAPGWFEVAHLQFWPVVWVLITLGLAVAWLARPESIRSS